MKPKVAVSLDQVNDLYNSCDIKETIYWGKILVVVYRLPNGFVLSDFSDCVSPENFDIQVGRDIIESKIKDKLWFLLSYDLQNKLGDINRA